MRKLTGLLCILAMLLFTAGCGETLTGIGKDINRMGRGVNTFFFRQP